MLGALVIILYPSIFSNAPSTLQNSQWMPQLTTMVPVLVFVIMALGLNVVVGYAGLLDLGYVAFYAAGAYVAGWFASQQFAPHNVRLGAVDITQDTPGIHISPWLLIVVGAVFAALLGVIIGVPTLRLRGDYLAIVTLGFGEIIPQVVRNGNSFFGFNVTNGPAGLTGLDPMGFGSTLHGGSRSSRSTSPSSTTRTSSSTGRSSCCLRSRSSAWCACATRGSVAPGSRSARTRTPPPRWASR